MNQKIYDSIIFNFKTISYHMSLSTSKQRSRDKKSFKSEQQSTLIGILNKYYSIEISSPTIKSHYSTQFFHVKRIYMENEVINVKSVMNSLCTQKYNEDIKKVSLKTTKRRRRVNKIIMEIDFLSDIMFNKGFYFIPHSFNGINYEEVVYNRRVILNKNCITKIGDEISSYVSYLFDRNPSYKSIIISCKNNVIENIMLKYNCFI